MTQAVILLTGLQAAQAWRLREFGWFGIAHYTAGPALMALVTVLALLVTGTSPVGVTAACVIGSIAQLAAEKLRALRSRKQDRDA